MDKYILAERLKSSRILITGGTGFVGKSVLLFLNELNRVFDAKISILSLSRNPDKTIASWPGIRSLQNVKYIAGDIADIDFNHYGPIDYIIHAATDGVNENSPDAEITLHKLIVGGTQNILDQAKKHKIKRMIYLSSGAVYGQNINSAITEDHNCTPYSIYGRKKLEAEYCCTMQETVNCSIARLFSFIGPFLPLDSHFAVGNFMKDAILGNDIIIKGNGLPVRSYMYSRDLATSLVTILVFGQHKRVYNVGSDEQIRIKDLAIKIATQSDKQINLKILGQSISGAANYYVPSITRLTTELSFTMRYNLDDSVRNYMLWAKQTLRK